MLARGWDTWHAGEVGTCACGQAESVRMPTRPKAPCVMTWTGPAALWPAAVRVHQVSLHAFNTSRALQTRSKRWYWQPLGAAGTAAIQAVQAWCKVQSATSKTAGGQHL